MKVGAIVTLCSFLFVGLICLSMWGCPTYSVWSQEMKGRAELARAEQNKQIMFIEAQAMLEAERFNAQSEIVRAEGMAQAMEIENGQLTDIYIRYLFVRALENLPEGTQVIYLPAADFMPINEAGRR